MINLQPNLLDQLHLFVVAAKLGSFSATARATSRAHSVVSYGISNLEGYLEVTLFDRSGHKAVLTAAGHALLREAQTMVDAATALKSKAREFSTGLETRLTVAIDDFVAITMFNTAFETLASRYPGLEMRLIRTGARGAENLVRNEQATLGISAGALSDGSGFDAVLLGNITLLPVVATGTEKSNGGANNGEEGEEIRTMRQIVLSGVEEPEKSPDLGVLSSRIWRVSDLQTKLDLILDGLGWGMMPQHLVEKPLADKVLSRLSLRQQMVPPQIPIFLIHRVDSALGPAGALLHDAISQPKQNDQVSQPISPSGGGEEGSVWRTCAPRLRS